MIIMGSSNVCLWKEYKLNWIKATKIFPYFSHMFYKILSNFNLKHNLMADITNT